MQFVAGRVSQTATLPLSLVHEPSIIVWLQLSRAVVGTTMLINVFVRDDSKYNSTGLQYCTRYAVLVPPMYSSTPVQVKDDQ